jgi:glycosyltransferase involved in cell wall biosynthesis
VLIENTRGSLLGFLSLKLRLSNYSKLKKAVESADKLIVRMPCAEGATAVRIAKKAKIDTLVECVGCVWDGLWNYNLKGKLIAGVSYLQMRSTVKSVDHVLYVTNSFLQKRYPTEKKSVSCSNVVLKNINGNVLVERKNKISSTKDFKNLVIGTLAAVDVPHKGHEYVLRAIADLKKQGYTFQYQIAGAGSNDRLLSMAERYGVKNQILFMGSLKHEEVFSWLDTIDLYIQPSKQEGVPRALLEAMSRACPAIGSNAGGIPEALSASFVFKKGNINELGNKLLAISNRKTMLIEAERNFNKSKEYGDQILTSRRNAFFDSFVGASIKEISSNE